MVTDGSGREPRESFGIGSYTKAPVKAHPGPIFTLITIIKYAIFGGPGGKATMISADLGTQLESFVSNLVETGRYNSKSEVLREGIRLIQEREARLVALDHALARGMADTETGRVKPMAEVAARLERKYSDMGRPAE